MAHTSEYLTGEHSEDTAGSILWIGLRIQTPLLRLIEMPFRGVLRPGTFTCEANDYSCMAGCGSPQPKSWERNPELQVSAFLLSLQFIACASERVVG